MPMIDQIFINDICIHYERERDKVKEYVKTIYLKDFFIKLFMKMLDYNIDSKLLSLMKELIMKQDFDYFDKYLMPYFISLNPRA
jgi:hypothetical protein